MRSCTKKKPDLEVALFKQEEQDHGIDNVLDHRFDQSGETRPGTIGRSLRRIPDQ